MPVVIVLQGVMYDMEAPWPLKLTLICVVTALSLFYSYRYVVSRTWIDRLLSN